MIISNSTLTGNIASYGGAIYNDSGGLTISNSTLICNTANTQGDAIYNSLADATVNFNRIINNSIWNEGGGPFNAKYNWWGSNLASDVASKIYGIWNYDPWVILSIGVTPNQINGTSTSTITADLNHDSNHAALVGGQIPDGVPVTFAYLLGTVTPNIKPLISGTASSLISAISPLSGTGYVSANVDGYTEKTLLTVDWTIPTPLIFDPVNNALNIPVNKVIRVIFSEPVKAGNAFNSIILKDNYGANIPITKTFSLNDYNPSFFDLIITRSSGTYPKGYRYTLSIPMNSIMDLAGNGIDRTYINTFTIVTLPPTVTANIKGGYYNTTKTISLTMNEPGIIYYTTNGATPSISSTHYTKPLIISSTKTLKYIAQDLAGNISPVYTQKYIIDKTAPKVSSTTPTNYKTGVSKSSTIYVKFLENIKSSTYYNSIKIKNLSTNKYVSITKSMSANTLSIKTSSTRSSNTWYQVIIPKAAIKDYASNNLTANYTFRFKTGK